MNLLAAGTAVCDLQLLTEGQAQGFTLGEGEWPLRGLVVMHQGEVRAFVNQCPHAGHRLDFPPGRFLTPDGELLLCRSHGAVFDKGSGECVAGPCTGERLRPLAVRVDGDQVQLTADVDVDALVTRYW
jgi:nitrite reductase/ring-hydroxylating ferredoxin subunit